MPKLSPVAIRSAQQDDLKAVSTLLVHSFNHGLDEGIGRWVEPVLRLSIQADLRQRARTQTNHYSCIVAVRQSIDSGQDIIIGTVEMSVRRHNIWLSSSQHIYISNLAVQQQNRRQGVAYRLLQECEAVATQWGFTSLYLHVRENNTAARQLYQQFGYRLKTVDFNLGTVVLRQPRTLLLCKHLGNAQPTYPH